MADIHLYPEYVAACRRIVAAAKRGRGVRLSAEEVRQAAQDMSNWECVTRESKEAEDG